MRHNIPITAITFSQTSLISLWFSAIIYLSLKFDMLDNRKILKLRRYRRWLVVRIWEL
jgi:hypothetical protein